MPEARQVDLFEWIEGSQLGTATADLADEKQFARIYRTAGELAALLHNHAAAWPLPAGFERHAWGAQGLMGEAPIWGRFWELEDLSPDERGLVRRARHEVRRALLPHPRIASNYSLIHADLHPENMLVQGERVRVIDFDDAGFGWHLYELATMLWSVSPGPWWMVIAVSGRCRTRGSNPFLGSCWPAGSRRSAGSPPGPRPRAPAPRAVSRSSMCAPTLTIFVTRVKQRSMHPMGVFTRVHGGRYQ